MNEILSVLYFIFYSNEIHLTYKDCFESDIFFCFSNLINSIKEIFYVDKNGLFDSLTDFDKLFYRLDNLLWNHFKKNEINSHFYVLKWFLPLFSQTFEMEDLLILWDSLFSHPKMMIFLKYFSISILIHFKYTLLKFDNSSQIISFLQNIKKIDIIKIIEKSDSLYNNFSGEKKISKFVIYWFQALFYFTSIKIIIIIILIKILIKYWSIFFLISFVNNENLINF